jgi:uncharacterized membrane protein (UPF0127 family)
LTPRRGDDLKPGAEARPFDLAVGLARAARPLLVGVLVVAVIGIALALGANGPADPTLAGEQTLSPAPSMFEERRLLVGDRCLTVEVANTDEARAQGLRGRDTLGRFNGMLFEFPQLTTARFTMSNTKIPLTVGFYDENGGFIQSVDMEPCPEGNEQNCPTYGANAPFRSALEVAKGQLPPGNLGTCPA